MGTKRALVVDDSRSARKFLSGMLEKYEIDVDSAESAEQAIEYLTHHRPDVIFMDHLMPGMDGFQALHTIKNNPRTATIPVLMYTSQEGELYVGQARALGAVGVLPKQIKLADVSKILYQLHLLPDRRSSEQTHFHQPGSGAKGEDQDQTAPLARPVTEAALREHFAELRRTLGATLDSHANRTRAELHATLEKALAGLPVSNEPPSRVPWGWIAATIAGIVAAGSLSVAYRESLQRSAPGSTVAQPKEHPASAVLALDAPQSQARSMQAARILTAAEASGGDVPPQNEASARTSAAPAAARIQAAANPIVEVVPYGEDPLSGPRLDVLRELFDRLIAQGFHGTVDIRVFPGRFCLTGDSSSGFMLAPDDTAYSQCALVGSPTDDPAPKPPRVSLGFADLAAELRAASHGAADVQVAPGDAKSMIVSYPPASDWLTAGEWNRAASANNRIEIRLR